MPLSSFKFNIYFKFFIYQKKWVTTKIMLNKLNQYKQHLQILSFKIMNQRINNALNGSFRVLFYFD